MYNREEFIYHKDGDKEFRFGTSSVLQTTIVFFVSYDYDNTEMPGTILKHGSKETINDYMMKNLTKYQELEKHPVFARTQHIIINVTDYELDEINKCLEITGYVGKFMDKFDLVPDEFDEFEEIP